MATGGEHSCEPVQEGTAEAREPREGGGAINGDVCEELKVWYPLRNPEMRVSIESKNYVSV